MRTIAVITVLVFSSACRCGSGGSKSDHGELVVVGGDASLSSEGTVSIGRVLVGKTKAATFTLRNRGKAALSVTGPVKVEGVDVGEAGTAAPFIVELPQRTLAAAEELQGTVTFQPAVLGAAHAVIRFDAPGAAEGFASVTLTLDGEGVQPSCALPDTLDFGEVAIGVERSLTTTLENSLDVDVTARVNPVTGPDALSFTRTAPVSETSTVPSGRHLDVELTFHPTEVRAYWASVKVELASCPAKIIALHGQGASDRLRVTPDHLNFGFVLPGQTAMRTVTIDNLSSEAVTVTSVTFGYSDFSTSTPTVPAFASATMPVTFTPHVLGARSTSMTIHTLVQNPQVTITAFGGGPDIDIKPATASFGRVPFFSGGGSSATRHLVVKNVGTHATTDPAENLYLGKADSTGHRTAPYAEVRALDPGTSASEVSVTLDPMTPYSDVTGLDARAGRFINLELTLTPSAIGPKGGTIAVQSNDPDEPEVLIPFTANVLALPPCNLEVSPPMLQFGVVQPPSEVRRVVTFTNRNTQPGDICLLSDLHLSGGSDATFSLPGGEVTEKELQPQERWQLEVRAAPTQSPTAYTQVTGQLVYSSSSAPTPAAITLSATLGAACLTISPNHVDFGGLRVGCQSAEHQLVIYNSCSTPLVLTGFAMVDGAGQSAGGPDCSGTSPCPEFSLTQTPALPVGGLVVASGAAPVMIAAAYHPIDVNSDVGALSVAYTVGSSTLQQLVSFAGHGTVDGQTTDVFRSTGTPKVDVLFSIDGSCSMQSKQQSLSQNLPAFFTQALASNVDYHLGVVVGQGPPSNTSRGVLFTGPGHPAAVLTPALPDAQQQFSAKVAAVGAQGADEECFQPVLDALSAPLVNGQNAGFLRPDARLAIVCVTDDSDYSSQSVSYYVSALLNVKAGRASDFSVSAIAGYTQNCNSTLLEDGRYAQVTAATGGIREEICTQNWSTSLGRLGGITFGDTGWYYLRATPDTSGGHTIEVRVDGVLVPENSPRGSPIWHWDPVTNAVQFEELFKPSPGQSVEVTYSALCH